jgi:integrase
MIAMLSIINWFTMLKKRCEIAPPNSPAIPLPARLNSAAGRHAKTTYKLLILRIYQALTERFWGPKRSFVPALRETAARTGEVIGTRWDDVDLDEKIWVVPAAPMKAGRQHQAPLSAAAVAIREQMKKIRESDLVFPGGKKGKPLSNMTMSAVLKRMDRDDLTNHGFRSSFRCAPAPFRRPRAEARAVRRPIALPHRRGSREIPETDIKDSRFGIEIDVQLLCASRQGHN